MLDNGRNIAIQQADNPRHDKQRKKG